MSKGIILFGAMGVGDTTLGRVAARLLDWPHFDIDDFIWRWDTEIPYTATRPREEKIALLTEAISHHPHFVMSGSMFSFRKAFESSFGLAVFLTAPAEVCAERVRLRSVARWGERVLPGGDMYEASSVYRDYLANARRYLTGTEEQFSLAQHEAWIRELPCPVLRMDGTRPISENADQIVRAYHSLASACPSV